MELKKREREARRKRIKNNRVLYLMILPILLWYVLFCYLPIAGGLSLSFRNYRFDMGIWKSPFGRAGTFSENDD